MMTVERHVSAASLWLYLGALAVTGCREPQFVNGDVGPGDMGRTGDPRGGDYSTGDPCGPWEECARGDEDCCWCNRERLSTTGTYADYPDIEVDSTGKYHAVWNQADWQDVVSGNDTGFTIVYVNACPLNEPPVGWPAGVQITG